MKRFIILLIMLSLLLCSCGAVNGADDATDRLDTSELYSESEDEKDTENKTPEAISLTVSEDTVWGAVYILGRVLNGCELKGSAQSVRITLPSTVYLFGDLTISNVTLVGSNTTIYANGYKLKICSDVVISSRDDRLTIYGGSESKACAKTNIELLGGHYKNVFGGGNGKEILGNTNVIFGGNANNTDTNDDSASNMSPCNVYGGGNNASVGGSANVTISGNAVAKFVSGVGSGESGGKVKTANINIKGGKLMNVFGGSLNADVTDLKTNITMTGGLCEAIFGGCQGKNMSGTVDIKLLGGDISRRVYTGCYNNCDVGLFSDTWTTSCKVTGTTTLSIGPNMKLCTGTGLSSDNDPDMGVFCGSRYKSAMSGEKNILVFLDGCYDKMIGSIGPSPKSGWDLCKSHHSEIIKK